MGLVVNNRAMVATSGGADSPPFLMAGTNSAYATMLVTGYNGTGTPQLSADIYQSNDGANWVLVGSSSTPANTTVGDVVTKDSGVAIGAAWCLVRAKCNSGFTVEITLNVNTSQR